MGRFFVLLFLPLLSLLLPASAQYEHFERGHILLFNHESIRVFFFDSKDMELHVMDEGDIRTPRYGSLEQAMQRSTCLAGINASYFAADEAHSPLGLVISQGKQISPFSQGRFTVAGTLYDTGSQIKLERSSKLSTPISQMKAAVQAGPFLIEGGKPVAGLDAERIAARSFVATDGKGKWCIGMATARSLKALAEELSTKGSLGDFHVEKALNLDGGSSCSFWAWKHCYIPSYKHVRNYAGIRPRQ